MLTFKQGKDSKRNAPASLKSSDTLFCSAMQFPYQLFRPLHYEPKYAYPLLIWLHNTGSDEQQLLRVIPQVSLRNCVAAAPQGSPVDEPLPLGPLHSPLFDVVHRPKIHYGWLDTSDEQNKTEQKVLDCITLAKQRANIHDKRIFVAGFGSGGTAALRTALTFPDMFAGVASFGGKYVMNNFRSPALMQSKLNVLIDSYNIHLFELFYTSGISLRVCECADTPNPSPEMLKELNQWMIDIVNSRR